jgi:hypothetical protein
VVERSGRLFNHADPDDMTDAQKAELSRVQDAWTTYSHSSPHNQALAVTGQSEFMKYFLDPTLQPDN